MSPGKDYLYCAWCRASNITHRRHCWRCGGELPYFVDCHGQSHVQIAPWETPGSPTPAEIEALLAQATIIQVEQPAPPVEERLRDWAANLWNRVHRPRPARSRHTL